jgi:hypothetical protein
MLYDVIRHAMNSPATPPRPTKGRTAIVKAVRIEADLYDYAQSRVRTEDLDFSKYIRRLIRAERSGQLALSH